jgi:hypothetical protein
MDVSKHISTQYTEYKGGEVIEHEMCFDFLYNFCLKNFSFLAELSEMWLNTYLLVLK